MKQVRMRIVITNVAGRVGHRRGPSTRRRPGRRSAERHARPLARRPDTAEGCPSSFWRRRRGPRRDGVPGTVLREDDSAEEQAGPRHGGGADVDALPDTDRPAARPTIGSKTRITEPTAVARRPCWRAAWLSTIAAGPRTRAA